VGSDNSIWLGFEGHRERESLRGPSIVGLFPMISSVSLWAYDCFGKNQVVFDAFNTEVLFFLLGLLFHFFTV
jgi:hypothetical protein